LSEKDETLSKAIMLSIYVRRIVWLISMTQSSFIVEACKYSFVVSHSYLLLAFSVFSKTRRANNLFLLVCIYLFFLFIDILLLTYRNVLSSSIISLFNSACSFPHFPYFLRIFLLQRLRITCLCTFVLTYMRIEQNSAKTKRSRDAASRNVSIRLATHLIPLFFKYI
jgi:hypothetical protein